MCLRTPSPSKCSAMIHSLSEHILGRIAENLANIGAISLHDYLDGQGPAAPHPPPTSGSTPIDGNVVTRLHQACQRAFRNTDALKFEFIEQSGSRNKQCVLTITKPDGVHRSYATQPVFAKKSEAKSEAAKIAIDMGALDFLTEGDTKPIVSAETSSADNVASDAMSAQSETAPETSMDDIERCCLEWRASRVTPHWVPFFDAKLAHKQGCALRIQLSPHVVRVYLSNPSFDTYSDAKGACAKAAVFEGVLDFIKHGNGQTHPSSPGPSTSSTTPPVTVMTPWTLQGFYDSLPRPFPESFETNNASEINAPGWLNTMVQNARGGKLILSFFFTSDGPPGLHGCLLKLDRPGEYKASLVDARFPKRSDAKAAVCLQAMSEGIGNYIRSITSAIDTKITVTMRSFSNSLVYPALTSELSKIDTDLYPHFEYDKERDAFGASLVVRLSTSPTSEQVRRYTVPSDYRHKADAKVGVICHAAEQGVVEFVRFRGEAPPARYTSPYILYTYNPEASRKRKEPGSAEDAEQGRPAKKKKKGKRRAVVPSHGEGTIPLGQFLPVHPSGDQIHGISRPGDMGLSQSVPPVDLCDPSQPGVGSGSGSGAAHPAVYGHGPSYSAQTYVSSYPAVLDPRFAGGGGLGSRAYSTHSLLGAYGGPLARAVDPPPPESGPSCARPGTSSRALRQPAEHAELEPGEVVSSAESDFSESSSRNEDGEVRANKQGMRHHIASTADGCVDTDANRNRRESADVEDVAREMNDKGKSKEVSPANTSTTVSLDGPGGTSTSHVNKLIDYCAIRGCGVPSFHEMQSQGRFQVWIVIGQERFDLPRTYRTVEEGRQRVAKQVLARLSKGGVLEERNGCI
ncbi:hypothetical protein J3R83DRAFT_9402 [Lanmaoa asiatica]|nr:hypothetical protein J3R83DRAFT_9402 [Lanmaoa asiatica]